MTDLEGCLTALAELRREIRLEVVVVDRLGQDLRDEVRQKFPWVSVHSIDRSATIPEMRAAAFRRARGRAVAVIEDHVLVAPGWGRYIVEALASETQAIGGPIENAATETLVDWAAFLCEYSHCIPPLPAGAAHWLPGNNVAYRQEILEQYRQTIEAGHWEGMLHQALQQHGIQLICSPALAVMHKKHYTFLEYLHQRYLYSRSYAGSRLTTGPSAKRLAFGFGTLILPPLLLIRIGRQVLAKRKHRWILLKCLPLISVFVISWAFGELIGYWFGSGTSMSKVR